MKINNLQKSINIYEKVKTLDAEIISIEKHAELISNGDAKIDLKLSVQNKVELEKENDKKEKSDFEKEYKFDFESILGKYKSLSWGSQDILASTKNECPHTKNFEANLSDVIALEVMGILLSEKLKTRANLIAQLNKLGIKLNEE